MRKLYLYLFALTLLIGCKKSTDIVIAEAFHHKLYLSEVRNSLPHSASKEDSLLFMEQFVDNWILRQTLLAHAKYELTQKEQNFSSQITQYQEQLLINAYFQKMSSYPASFEVSPNEIQEFLNEIKTTETPEYREMIKLNYIKFSARSKFYYKIKTLFFDETDRMNALQKLEMFCADTIEYYLDSEHWFYNDILEHEFPFSISNKGSANKLDFVQDDSRFLVFILDRKQQLQTKNVMEDRKMAQALLQQQKRTNYFRNFQDSVVRKALAEKKVVKYFK